MAYVRSMNSLQEQFDRDGFLVLEHFYTPEKCDELRNRAMQLCEGYTHDSSANIFKTHDQAKENDQYFLDSSNNISYFFEKDAIDEDGQLKQSVELSFNKIGHAIHDLDPVFDAFSRSPELCELSAAIGAQDHLLLQSMYIFKHARIGGIVDVHQDATFLYTEPQSCIGFWFALEDATIENGCLWAKAGGHKTTLRERFVRTPQGGTAIIELDETPLSTEGMLPLEVKKGTCIALHGLLPHYSLPNMSGKSRHAYSIHTISKYANYPSNNWLQPEGRILKGFQEKVTEVDAKTFQPNVL